MRLVTKVLLQRIRWPLSIEDYGVGGNRDNQLGRLFRENLSVVLDPPKDGIELGERIWTFWGAWVRYPSRFTRSRSVP